MDIIAYSAASLPSATIEYASYFTTRFKFLCCKVHVQIIRVHLRIIGFVS